MQQVHKSCHVLIMAALLCGLTSLSWDTIFGNTQQINPRSGDKPTLVYENGDIKLKCGGTMRFDIWQAKNITLLNSHLPDEYNFTRQTVDFTGDLAWGNKTFDYNALRLFINARQKSFLGDGGRFVSTVSQGVMVDDSAIGRHSHINNKLLIWLRTAYMEFALNALCGRKGDEQQMQMIRAGWFPFSLGRGIALGEIYGLTKDFLGIQTSYLNDVNAPGFMLSGELVPDQLSYAMYYAKLDEKSASFGDTFAAVKAHIVGRYKTPWRGVAQDNDLVAGKLMWSPLNGKLGVLNLEPYIMYNVASDRAIERDLDSKLGLGATGISIEYELGNFEIGGETAFNFGGQEAFHIDRNGVRLRRDTDSGAIVEKYSHVVFEATNKLGIGCGKPNNAAMVPYTTEVKKLIKQNLRNTENCLFLGTLKDGKNIYNASNRYRPAYKNTFRGWMAVVDAAYNFKSVGFKPAVAWGYASGDDDPNMKHHDDVFRGFIGLQEGYVGKRVMSLLVLDARKIKRPFFIPNDQKEAGDDGDFTDIQFVGMGATWLPLRKTPNVLSFQTNILAYWKTHAIGKFDRVLGKSLDAATCPASKFLGTEWNMRIRYEAMKDFVVFTDLGAFFPGGFYEDVKGTPLRGDIVHALDLPDNTTIEPEKYRLSTDRAFMLNFGFWYRF